MGRLGGAVVARVLYLRRPWSVRGHITYLRVSVRLELSCVVQLRLGHPRVIH